MLRQILFSAAFVLPALAATADELGYFTPSTIQQIARPLNCVYYTLNNSSQRGSLPGALPDWKIFNEGPGTVVIRGGGARTREIEAFDGRLVTFPGVLGVRYSVGLGSGGPANVHICRV